MTNSNYLLSLNEQNVDAPGVTPFDFTAMEYKMTNKWHGRNWPISSRSTALHLFASTMTIQACWCVHRSTQSPEVSTTLLWAFSLTFTISLLAVGKLHSAVVIFVSCLYAQTKRHCHWEQGTCHYCCLHNVTIMSSQVLTYICIQIDSFIDLPVT